MRISRWPYSRRKASICSRNGTASGRSSSAAPISCSSVPRRMRLTSGEAFAVIARSHRRLLPSMVTLPVTPEINLARNSSVRSPKLGSRKVPNIS